MVQFLLTHLDWVAAIFELAGLYLVGNKNKVGFILNLICGISWIAYTAINHTTYGILLVIIPALFINCRNYVRWLKEEARGK